MIIFYFPPHEKMAKDLCAQIGVKLGSLEYRQFPEGESYIKINSDVKNKKVILLCGLENANSKIMPLIFFAKTAQEFGASAITLVAPYLGYMRMDARFKQGEAVTSNIFAQFLSQYVDKLITIDPHLHRHKKLEEIYSIKCQTLHAAEAVSAWIAHNVENPLLIGPDEESSQWVSSIAQKCNAPFLVMEKIRYGDFSVEISAEKNQTSKHSSNKISTSEIKKYQNYNPILVDDIIGTATTMIKALQHLQTSFHKPIICIGVHAIFTGEAFKNLQEARAKQIVTCNTIPHISNAIDITSLIAQALVG